jgi:uncharacterized SAM-dependent methyltransferase
LLLGEPYSAEYVRRVELIDVSATALRDAARRLGEKRTTSIVTHEMRYEDGLDVIRASAHHDERTLVLFLGSNIGNFDVPGAEAFLKTIRASLAASDSLLIGVDLVKPAENLLRAYDDPLGVTAAFNKNLLVRLNRELGSTFDVDQFDHRAVWNAEASRVEMHLVSRVTQRVDVPAAGLSFALRQDETIWTESSYKYTPSAFERLLSTAGLPVFRRWQDDTGQFLLVLAARA